MSGKLGKLGGYSQRGNSADQAHWLAAGYSWAVALNHDPDFWRPIVDRWQTRIISRTYFGDQSLSISRVPAVADAICRDADRLRPLGCTTVMGFNETSQTTEAELTALAAFEAPLIGILKSRGYDYAAGSFSVTWPKLGHLYAYREVLGLTRYVKKHEYDAPSMRSHIGVAGYDDRVLQYRQLYPEMRRLGFTGQLIIGECGIDGGVLDGQLRGFRAFDTDYFADLAWYAGELAKDDYVAGAVVFGVGMNGDWESFDVVGSPVAARLDAATFPSEVVMPIAQPIRVWRRATGAIETMDLEEYLRGVVPAEMPASWPDAALSAQAVASRTYAMIAIAHPRHADRGADVSDWTCCQVWTPTTHERTDAAIVATAGMTWSMGNGSYKAECGRQDCPYCRGAPGTNGQAWPGELCQNGARTMATAGSTYREILAHYYGSTTPAEPPAEEASTDVKAYTWDGQPTTVEALQAVYGFDIRRAVVAPGAEVIRLVAIREKYGDSSQIAKVTRAGVPEPGINVAWHWPDATTQNVPNQWDAHYELAPTNGNGEVGPGMGMGAYHAVGQPGPHGMWVVSQSTKSDAVFGLGMITQTNHNHCNLEFNITVEPAVAPVVTEPFTAPELAAVGEMWSATPATMKAAAAMGLHWLNERAPAGSNYYLFVALDEDGKPHRLKQRRDTLAVVADEVMAE